MPEPKIKPFPWRCPACSKREVRTAVVSYTAEIKHDGRLHTIPVPGLRVPKCDACGELVFGNEADGQIIAALRAKLGLLTPEEVRGGRESLGLTQKEFAERLGVAAETVSRWETGSLIQSRAMDNLLRLFLTLPEVRRALATTRTVA